MVKLNTAEEYIAYFTKHPEPWSLSLPMEERTKVFAYADEHKIDLSLIHISEPRD